MLGMSSGATAWVLIIAIIALWSLGVFVSSHIRDARVAKHTGKPWVPHEPAGVEREDDFRGWDDDI